MVPLHAHWFQYTLTKEYKSTHYNDSVRSINNRMSWIKCKQSMKQMMASVINNNDKFSLSYYNQREVISYTHKWENIRLN